MTTERAMDCDLWREAISASVDGEAYGIDPMHFGVIMVLAGGLGLMMPPIGSVLFVGSAIGGITITEAMRSIWPFFFAALTVLLLVTFIPALSLTLPAIWR